MSEVLTALGDAFAFWRAGLTAGEPLHAAPLGLLALGVAYALVRRLARARWLRLLMLTAFWGGVASIVSLAALSLSYYRIEAWLPLGGEILAASAHSALAWALAGVVLGGGLALRRAPAPVRREPDDDLPAALLVEPGE